MNCIAALTIFNTIFILFIIFNIIPNYYRIEFHIEKSWHAKIPLSFNIIFWRGDSGHGIFHIPLRFKPLEELEDWHIHKLRHFKFGCNVGANCIDHNEECRLKYGTSFVDGRYGSMDYVAKEIEWNKANLKKAVV